MNTASRVAIYGRVSTTDGRQDVENQLNELRRFAATKGWDTWGQNLHHHPHLHCVVPGGGCSPDGSRWIACRKRSFFLPYKVLTRLFRKLFLLSLGRAFRKGQLRLSGELRNLAKPAAFV